MKRTYADTFFFLALLNPQDAHHHAARAASQNQSGELVTSQYVLIEVGDALADPRDRPKFLSLLEQLNSDPDVLIVAATDELLHEGVELYRNRPDKDWPLTDCLSFVVMRDLGIQAALTGDRHFQQAGFVPLLAAN